MASTKNEVSSLTKEKLVEMLEKMLVIRHFEEASIKAYQQKKIAGFLHTYIGQEAVGVGTLAHKLPQDSAALFAFLEGCCIARECPRAGLATTRRRS